MPAPTTVPELTDLLRKSGLIEPALLDEYLSAHPEAADAPTELVARLQADGVITKFHAAQLLKGKYRGFFLGKYKLLDRIGLGGMGQVFLAEHGAMRRRVAIKVLPPDRAENQFSKERFLREARAIGQLDHPNLVRAYDVDADADVIFLVMEFVDGVTFHDLVTRVGPVGPARVAYYLWQAAHGLAYLDANRLVHRDIKPANLLVDRHGTVKILDLGLVRSSVEEDELTRQEGVKILGTADYLAPEQAINCSAVDVRADLYSLGATGYFLLTGRPPFGGGKVAHKLLAHQVQAVTPVHELNPAVPVELSDVITKLLAKKPTQRFQTPAELIAALDRWAASPPPPPADHEIPAISGVGESSGVSVGLSGLRTPRPGSGSTAVGSRIRLHSDSNQGTGSRPIADILTPAPKAATPVPPVRPTAPRPVADSPDLPPVLPAVRTFGTPPPRVTPADLVPLFKRPEQAPAAADTGRRMWVLVAIGLAAAVVGSVAVGVAGLVR